MTEEEKNVLISDLATKWLIQGNQLEYAQYLGKAEEAIEFTREACSDV